MEDKVKVKVTKRYHDIALDKIQEAGATFETSKKRAEHLVKEGVAEIAGTARTEKTAKSGKEEGKEQ